LVFLPASSYPIPTTPTLPRSRPCQRTLTNKTISCPTRKRNPQILNRRIRAQPRQNQRPKKVQYIPRVHPPAIGHEAPHKPFEPTVAPPHRARGGIEALVGAHGVPLAHVGDRQHGGEGVGEVQDAEGGHHGGEADEVGDAGADDEGDDPVDGDEDDPGDLAGFGGQGRGVEHFDEDVVVDDYWRC